MECESLSVDRREKIAALEAAMRHVVQSGEATEQACPLTHRFAPGLYAREISVPAGTVVVTKLHKRDHVTIVSLGRCLVFSETGSREIAAPSTFITQAGTKRAIYVLEDTVWTTVHASHETDLVKLEEELIAPNYEALEIEARKEKTP